MSEQADPKVECYLLRSDVADYLSRKYCNLFPAINLGINSEIAFYINNENKIFNGFRKKVDPLIYDFIVGYRYSDRLLKAKKEHNE